MTDIALILTTGFCLWAITDKHIPTGVLITSGLALVACGCLAELDGNAYLDRIIALRGWGHVLIGCGFFWNLTGRRWWLTLSMRWHFMHTWARLFGVERRSHRRE